MPIDKHAGWRSKSSKFRYVEDSLDKKTLSVGISWPLGIYAYTAPSFVYFSVTAYHGTINQKRFLLF